jgi:hypothetical protein
LTKLNDVKRGVEPNDLQEICNYQLNLPITRDEMFLIFHGNDKNGDGFLDRQEVANAFMPREPQYAEILNERGGSYGEEHDLSQIFQKGTRDALKNFFKGYVECEMALEKIR